MNQERLKLLLQLLNDIEVKGANNLNNLLASIQLVEGMAKEPIEKTDEVFPV